MNNIRFYLSTFLLCVGWGVALAQMPNNERTELIDEVLAGHRAARQRIQLLSVKVAIEVTIPKQPALLTGRYWRDGDTVRFQQGEEGKGTEDYLVSKGEIRQVGRGWKDGKVATMNASRRAATDFLGVCDVWREMAIELSGPTGGQYPLDRLYKQGDLVTGASREKKDGRNCIAVSMAYTLEGGIQSKFTVWHDRDKNYLVYKIEAQTGTTSKGIIEITDYAEPTPGTIFPIRCKRESYVNGTLSSQRVVTLTEIDINTPIPAKIMALPTIAAGTTLRDDIRGVAYPIDVNWNQMGQAKANPKDYHAPTLADPSVEVKVEYTRQTESEQTSIGSYIIYASLAVLAIVLVIRFILRFRARANA